ncbi:MAG: amino acid ABC transporter permease [Pseudotabrizicola sp.]|uniref:amino acid ABC transporter permease n=1 Tax=Pseudotabrizicola sp. TaxID=2939647 RepID=UPI00271C7339|nr:amino acid ABC transporter permease [Pseudotabrizicola sp.]MDO8882004.1 amino acid ABC transporter permease [Pseudotabrizicola sp.]MDP2079575.1 amino acid ABC transporter permease [Pseudotabrizicola sp.]MDZ7572407.1 amino acid ABC transporter permease [Pseudotabrizicola sp.]
MTPSSKPDKDFPWWLVILLVTGAVLFWQVLSNPIYGAVLNTLAKGIAVTIIVAVVAYLGACAIGLGLAVMGLSRFIVLRQAARLYIEIMRGVPIIVLLLYVAFVLAPMLVVAVNAVIEPLGLDPWRTRDFPLIARAVIALMLAYSAFLAEIFRAGLQAVPMGQVEAAQALGLSGWQRFRHIVFPQAFRMILPPLGNDFVAMVKDSSLVSVLGVTDVAQMAKVTAAGNFRYFETYNVAALIYLTMTIGLSVVLRRLETRLRARSEP